MSDMPDYVRAVYTSVKNTWQDAENLDDLHGYLTYVWIPEETFKVDVLKVRVYAEKFRAYSKSALAGGGTVVTSGASSITTTVAGGAHSHIVTGATSSYETPSHTHNVVIGAITSTSESNHKHCIGSSPVDGAIENTGSFTVYSQGQQAQGEVLIYKEGNQSIWTFGAAEAHNHNVDFGTKTSASGGASHAHTVSGQTAEAVTDHTHGMEHTHQVTLADHMHNIDFGIYEEAITGRTLSAALYDPDGNLEKDFGVVCTGEDNVTLDLSEYFETLKYGMHYMELTASGRLRARLVFYELCKMFAQF